MNTVVEVLLVRARNHVEYVSDKQKLEKVIWSILTYPSMFITEIQKISIKIGKMLKLLLYWV